MEQNDLDLLQAVPLSHLQTEGRGVSLRSLRCLATYLSSLLPTLLRVLIPLVRA